jgi:hypothetical protein
MKPLVQHKNVNLLCKYFDIQKGYSDLYLLIQLKFPTESDQQVVKNFYYDGLGRVKAVQSPYFDAFSSSISLPSAVVAFTNYSYDAMSRVVNVINPDSTTNTVVYDRWNVGAFDENGHRRDFVSDDSFYREYNALNQLVKIRNGSSSSSPVFEQYFYNLLGTRIKNAKKQTVKLYGKT